MSTPQTIQHQIVVGRIVRNGIRVRKSIGELDLCHAASSSRGMGEAPDMLGEASYEDAPNVVLRRILEISCWPSEVPIRERETARLLDSVSVHTLPKQALAPGPRGKVTSTAIDSPRPTSMAPGR